jgi:hypothetical protein
MAVEISETIIQTKEAHLQVLAKKYQAAYAQKAKALNETAQVSLDQEIAQLESEMQKTQDEIDELRKPQQSRNVNYRKEFVDWEEDLHKIDYSKVESSLNQVFKSLKTQEGSALFLLRKSRSMGGKWCIQKVKRRIQEDLGTLVAPCEIGFTASQQASSVAFLSRLAERYSVDIQPTPSNLSSCTHAIADHIIGSLTSGNIFLAEINLYTLNPQDSFLEWFVKDFWLSLVGRLPAISRQKKKVRLIAILAVRDSIPKACLPSAICCKKANFDGGKILELPLQKWKKEEICDWLFNFSGLTAQSTPLGDTEIDAMAQNIHAVTNGIPHDVYHELMDAMTQHAC